MGAKKQTVGYHYYFSILFGLSRGPLNELRTIKVGDKVAWEGPLCTTDVQAITKPNLFGGEKKEGGIQGPFRLFFGGKTQVLPGDASGFVGSSSQTKETVTTFSAGAGVDPYVVIKGSGPYYGTKVLKGIKSLIGGLVSDFRGTSMLYFDGLISSMNPYPKDWKFRVRRSTKGWDNDQCWYFEKARIFLADGKIHAMNPAHIIWECHTNRQWGRGLPVSLMDENSFIYSANTFCSEGFGLCIGWERKGQDLDQFIDMVVALVGAACYSDPSTGKMTLRPIRNDYDVNNLPLFTPTTGLVSIEDEQATSSDEVFNEMIGTGHSPLDDEDFQVKVHNLAARQSAGAPNPQAKEYPQIPTRELMARVLQRDLRESATGLKKMTVTLDRRGYKIRPGMPFRISDPRRGIANLVLRASNDIKDMSYKDGRIEVKCMADVWGMPASSFVAAVESSWAPPAQTALPATAQRLIEANYRDLLLKQDASVLRELDATDSLIGTLALSPNSTMYEYELATRAAGEAAFDDDTSGSFTGAATLVDAITPLQTTFAITGETDFAERLEGQAILVGDEQMELVDYNPTTHTVTVARGVADTLPAAHAAAATVWTIDDDLVGDQRAYTSGETVEAKILTRTAGDLLAPDLATTMSLVMKGRQGRPYPPGAVKVDGTLALTPLPGNVEHPAPVITWAHRDRLLQADQLVGHLDGSVGPEAGVTYTIRVYLPSAPTVAQRTLSGISGTSWTYDAAMQAEDGSPASVFVELEAVRDGLASLNAYRFRVTIKLGYGMNYGMNYGGA